MIRITKLDIVLLVGTIVACLTQSTFLTLKLLKLINWSWLLVFTPSITILTLCFICVLIVVFRCGLYSQD